MVNPSIDFKIRSNNGVAGDSSSKEIVHMQQMTNSQLKILTPSFSSTEQKARLRKSDLLLKKKEPSVIGRNSLDGAGDDQSSVMLDQHSMGSGGFVGGHGGSAIRESRFSVGVRASAGAIIVN